MASSAARSRRPLDGILVVDVSRMLPGAVLARTLVDLGARVVKVEDPAGGDPMRGTPPLVDGTGAAFLAFFRGTESVALDLRTPAGATGLRRLARSADVLVESFRPGTLERWGLGPADLSRTNPGLVTLSLSGYGSGNSWSSHPGHDLNFAAMSGFLSLLPPGAARIQPVDVATALQGAAAILGALLVRARTGAGARVEVPLAAATLPFVAWPAVDAHVGAGTGTGTETGSVSMFDGVFAGRTPCYARYACSDGRELAVAALEPKFWHSLCGLLGLSHLAGDGLDAGERGAAAARALGSVLSRRPAAEWVALAREHGLPLSAVATPGEVLSEGFYREAGLVEETPLPGGGSFPTPVTTPGRVRTAGTEGTIAAAPPLSPAPALGEATARVMAELGACREEIAKILEAAR